MAWITVEVVSGNMHTTRVRLLKAHVVLRAVCGSAETVSVDLGGRKERERREREERVLGEQRQC